MHGTSLSFDSRTRQSDDTFTIMASRQRVEAPVTFKAYLMCAFAAFAGVLFGYDSGYISSVLGMPEFKRQYGHSVPVTEDNPGGYDYFTWEKSLIVSILSVGTFTGAIIAGWLADAIGRRLTIIGPGCCVFIAGVTIQLAAPTIPGLVVGRLISGLGVGFISSSNILYMSEIAPRRVRGAIVSAYQFAITVGLMLASCVGYATKDFKSDAAYRIPIAMQFPFAIILAIGLWYLPESPRYWVKQGRLDKAAHALARLRDQPVSSLSIEDELSEIVASQENEANGGESSWISCFRGSLTNSHSNCRKVWIGTALQMMQQWTGINFIFYYNTTFFMQVGLYNPFLISMVTTVVNVASTPVSFYTVEKFGRRSLLVYGALAMCICEFIIAIVGVSAGASAAANYVLIVFVCIYVFFFASTWGPTAWVVIGEIFQLPIRSKGVALSTASNWFWNFVIGIITPFIVDEDKGNLGVKVFFVWGSTCLASALFAWVFVPETRGLTLEQVDLMMQEVPAYRSKGWEPQDTFSQEYGTPQKDGRPPYATSRPCTAMDGKLQTEESFIEMNS